MFQDEEYDIDALRLQTNTLLQTNNITAPRRHQNNQITRETLTELFNIDCINLRIQSPFCKRNIIDFLENFYTFDLEQHLDELLRIGQNISSRDKETFCNHSLAYTKYNRSFNTERDAIIGLCSDTLQAKYYIAKQLFNINNQLANNTIQPTVYTDKHLNAYKILSLAQLIVKDIENNILPSRRIESYVAQMQALLRRPNIEAIYRDMHYYIIHHHILPYTIQIANRDPQANQLRNQLLALNRNNQLLQHSGLQNKLINTSLIENIQTSPLIQTQTNTAQIIENLQTLPYIQINKSEQVDNDIFISGILQIADSLQENRTTQIQAT